MTREEWVYDSKRVDILLLKVNIWFVQGEDILVVGIAL